MNGGFIPVVVDRVDLSMMPTLKLKAPACMTMLQFVDKIRARLKLRSGQINHLVLKSGLAVTMSQNVGRVYRDNKNENGLLHLACITENTFGCIPPRKKPVKAKFPGDEALPFGAPEPDEPLYFLGENAPPLANPQPAASPPAASQTSHAVQVGSHVHGAVVHLFVPPASWLNYLQTAAANAGIALPTVASAGFSIPAGVTTTGISTTTGVPTTGISTITGVPTTAEIPSTAPEPYITYVPTSPSSMGLASEGEDGNEIEDFDFFVTGDDESSSSEEM